jgi:hypothetical protein
MKLLPGDIGHGLLSNLTRLDISKNNCNVWHHPSLTLEALEAPIPHDVQQPFRRHHPGGAWRADELADAGTGV